AAVACSGHWLSGWGRKRVPEGGGPSADHGARPWFPWHAPAGHPGRVACLHRRRLRVCEHRRRFPSSARMKLPEHELAPGTEFLRAGGYMTRRLASHDWSDHPLGPPEQWPVELKTTLSIILGSRSAMCVGWGPDLLLLYNDAYVEVLGLKEPSALGRPIREVWHELWEDVRGLAEAALAGTPTSVEDMYLSMERKGAPEDTWWTFTYTPVRRGDGAVVAMLGIVHETTRRVLSERRLSDERSRLAHMFHQ